MTSLDKGLLWDELNATDEDYIRRKLALGEYSAEAAVIVARWLVDHERRRQERWARSTLRWVMVGAIAASSTTVVTLAALFIAK